MLFFFISLISFLLLLFKSLPLKPLALWATEGRLLPLLFLQEFSCSLREFRLYTLRFFCNPSKMSFKDKSAPLMENFEETLILDLPELALELILGKLSPAGLCNMAGVCSSLRERCKSDHLWERHMREKWGRVIGSVARREWQWFLVSRKDVSGAGVGGSKPRRWMGSLACLWPLSWFNSKLHNGGSPRSLLPDDSIMSWYLALESGKFWFPAQVYNREHGHVGFMLSCYDAELCYDSHTDTFQARYPPHGRRTIVIEEGVQWDRIRAPPVDTCAHDLHASDCLHDLRPGDHIEIQWRRNKEFPYGWWYGVVGHLESCDGTEHFCRCGTSDTVALEFNQYTPGSRWRQTCVSRKDHQEEGNETDGFYGGIRKLQSKDEIFTWRRLFPPEILE